MQSSYQGLPQNTYPQTNDSDSESSVYYSGEDVSFANTSYLPSNSLNAAPMEGVENDELEMNLEAYYQVAAATSQSRLSETALQSHGISLLPQQPPQDPAYLASQIRLSHTPLQVNGIPPYPQPQPPRDPAYLASQSYLSSQTALQLQLHATTGEYHVQRQSIVDTRGVESSLGWIDITNSESMSTPMPRQLPLPLSTSSASSASSVTSTIIHASSDFCQPETQSEKMDEDYNELGSPRHVTRLPSRHVKKNVSSKRKGSERSGVNSDPRSLPITNPSTPNLKEKPHSDEPLPIVIRPTGADTIHPTTSKPSVENPQRPFDPPVDYIKLLMDTIGNMHIAHHETRDLLHVLDKRQQDMSATLQTALSSSGDSGRTEVAPRASRQQGKSKLKKRRGKLEKISQAMTDPQWSYFKDCIRKHLKRLLKVNRLDESLLKFAPLTPEEQEVYQNKDIRRLVPDLVITPENFRLDMTLPRTSAFNTEAQDVFVEDFMQKVKEQKWYAEEDIPESFLDYEIIYFAIHEHLHHVFAMYREACQEDGKELKENRQARSAKNTRKRTLFEERFSLVKKDSALAHHCHLLDIIGVQGMSSDESDYGGSQVVYNRILPGWRSQELQDFLWRLDDIRDEVAKRPVGKRRHGLQRGRQRLRTNLKINEESVAPPNLPCNCYRPRWLKGLRPYQLKQLEIVKDNYDFSAA